MERKFLFTGSLVLTIVVITFTFVYRVFAVTTIGDNITTTGRISLTNTNATVTTGVVDIDVTGTVNNVTGQDTTVTIQGGNFAGNALKTTLVSNSDLSGSIIQMGHLISLSGRSNASSGGLYIGSGIFASGSTNNSARYVDQLIGFTGEGAVGIDVANSGDVFGNEINIRKTAGTGNIAGVQMSLTNSSATTSELGGVIINITLNAAPTI